MACPTRAARSTGIAATRFVIRRSARRTTGRPRFDPNHGTWIGWTLTMVILGLGSAAAIPLVADLGPSAVGGRLLTP